MKIDNDSYTLDYDEQSHHIKISGSLRLNGLEEYKPILDQLKDCLENASEMTVDLCQLEFLNSSGIAMLSKFVIEARNKQEFSLKITGSNIIPWQGKSLVNLQRLYPALEVNII